MTEAEPVHVRAPEPINITVLRARNLRGSKGDTVNVMIKVEFGEKVLGESPKMDCTPDAPAEFNFSAHLNCTFEDPLALDEIATKPVVLTVIEVLPKERRQKEEKTNALGQCTVDLLPLVKGETSSNYTLVINSIPGSPLENIPPENPRPEMEVLVSVNEPLLDASQLNEGNLMTVTVESLFAPPESWQLTGTQYFYSAALPVPAASEDGTDCKKETPVVFPGGILKPGAEKELPNKQKKWANSCTAVGNSVYIPDSFIASDPVEDEDGDFRGKEDREHRHNSEFEKLRVTWNTERRCYLESSAVKGFQDSVAKNRYWPVEFFRLPQPSGNKAKKPGGAQITRYTDDDGSLSFHGVAFLNLAPLLYPGVKRIRGAYKVLPYTDHLLYEKTKRRVGISDESARMAMNQLNRSSASPAPKKGGAGAGKEKEGEKKDPKKGEAVKAKPMASTTLKSETGSEADGQPPLNAEGQQYADSKSYIMIDISLSRPLVPKRPPEEMARRVAELIPPRPAFTKRTDSAERAVEDYHEQIASVAALILEEFRDMFSVEMKEEKITTNEAMEERRQKLMYQLNCSGKYFTFKEQLKHSVIKIVREKYLRTTNFDDRQQLQTFLSELYVYLVDQMHESLNKVLQIEDQPPIPEPLTTCAQLKHFAREAEVNKDFDLATKYYQERIIRDELNADNWFDFGTFCLYINNVTKAEECFHKCISLNQRHMDGLMLYGVVCALAERNEAAETFFEAATNVDPKSILAWTMLGLFYDSISSEIGTEMAFIEADKLNMAHAAALVHQASDSEEQQEKEKDKEDEEKEEKDELEISNEDGAQTQQGMEAAEEFTEEGAVSASSLPDIKLDPTSGEKSPLSARSSLAKGTKTSSGKRELNNGGKSMPSRPSSTLNMKGSTRATPQASGGEAGGAGLNPEMSEDNSPAREPTPIPAMSIFMQAVDWLLEVKAIPFTEQALAHELLTSPHGKTPSYHIATARLQLQKEEYALAEESLEEALKVEHQNPDGWALMGHVKYLSGDNEAAQECYERTLSFVTDATETHSIFLRLASIYLQQSEFQNAKRTFLMACKRSPSCVSWLGVGIACYRLDELGEAEDALMEANILNNCDAEVWGYLSLVCLRTGRKVEAEQSYKHAFKLQLQDLALLAEINTLQRKKGFGSPEF